MGFVDFVDVLRQLTSAPVLKTMYGTAIFGNDVTVTLDHSGDLFRLVGVDHEHNFVVSHSRTPYGLKPPVVRCGKEDGLKESPAKFLRGGVYKANCQFATPKFGRILSLTRLFSPALAHCLKQTDTSGHRHIETGNRPRHRQ